MPKITDFGLAKFDRLTTEGNSGPTPTRTGEVVGTPNYMAPEQARGVSAIVTPLVDIYALGAILYELLTGRPPYNAPTAMDTLMQLLQEEVVPPRR
ncbi:MAG TPA: protein kinase, partial [Gemmatales bacterium]|nr:protein kinase [Gemmatales bacterium]